jgi:hypothetical protein
MEEDKSITEMNPFRFLYQTSLVPSARTGMFSQIVSRDIVQWFEDQ